MLRDLQYVWTAKSGTLASSFGALTRFQSSPLGPLDLGYSGIMNDDLDDTVLQAGNFLAHDRKPWRHFIAHSAAFCFLLSTD